MASEPASGRPSRFGADHGTARAGWIFSITVHALLVGALALAHFLVPPQQPVTPVVFELVNLEPPRLRPVAPPTPQPPPETPRPQARPPEPPRPTPAPRQPEAPPRPEPRATAPQPEPDTTLPVEEAPPDPGQLTATLVANIPSDPRLAFWAGRVRRMVEAHWNPPEGINVRGSVKTVVGFQVSRGGQVSNVEVTESAGNTLLDDLAKRTIMRVEQLPPIPESFPGEVLRVSYEFIYQGR